MSTGKTFVLVHGAWHGAWCWEAVAERLKSCGHRVFTPVLTGLGERAHLLSADITIDTFIDDVANVLVENDLADVVLIGHSFGGIVISGVADRMPERLRKLVFVDGIILASGESALDRLPRDVSEARVALAREHGGSLPVPTGASLGLNETDAAKIVGRLTPHPFGTFLSPLNLRHPLGNGVPMYYVVASNPIYQPLEASRQRALALGLNMLEINAGHDCMISKPEDLSRLLLDLAD